MLDKQLAKTLLDSKPKVTNAKGCWLWTGGIDQLGYGYIGRHGIRYKVHRLAAYLYLDYDMEDKKHIICHKPIICSTPECFNPDHLYIGDYSSNMLDAVLEGRSNSAKTHCKNGHEFTKANTIIKTGANGKSKRDCRICHNEKRLARYHKNRWRR